jgi:phenylacetate-CoA ligase
LRGVNLFPTQIEELILATQELSPHFQCVLTRAGNLDSMTVLVERREQVTVERSVGKMRRIVDRRPAR